MNNPLLVLQYPDPRRNRTVALAATRDWTALHAFKDAALAEARLAALRSEGDEILHLQAEAELHRLEKLLERLVPDTEDSEKLN